MDIFEAPIPDQIAHCESAIECLKSRLRFFRARLKKLNQLLVSQENLTSNPLKEFNNEQSD